MFLKRDRVKHPPKNLAPRSIAARLILSYSLSTSVLLTAALGVVYYTVSRLIDEEDRMLLRDKLREVQEELIGKPSAGPTEKGDLARKVDPGSRTYFVRVLDTTGQLLGETHGMREVLPVSIFPAPSKRESQDSMVEDRPASGRWFLLLSGWTKTESPAPRYLIQVAQDRSNDKQFLQAFLRILGGVLVSGTSTAILIGWFVARRGLKAVEEITAAVHRVESTQLHERVGTQPWPKELTALAAAFDAMLSRLEDAFQRLSRFSADLAHELRTPICNIRGEAEIALSRTRSAEEYREALASRIEELDRLSRMIESLLFIAHAENAETQINRTSIDGQASVRSVLDFYEAMAREQNVGLSVFGDVTLEVEPTLFRRALSNLISNALSHTPTGGHITVHLSAKEGWSQVEVRDTGYGIKAEHLPHVFDRFFRAEESRHTTGTGLGLAIVKSIMDLHGGKAAIDSVENHGTVVRLQFPKRDTPTSGIQSELNFRRCKPVKE